MSKGEKPVCAIDGCTKISKWRGYCGAHYHRFQRYGDAKALENPFGKPLDFIEAIAPSEGCIMWPFALNSSGYGVLIYGGKKTFRAHRLVCMKFWGEAPPDKQLVAHSCGNPRCVNPNHLRWANSKENSADAVAHGTVKKGEDHYRAALEEGDISKIRELLRQGKTRACIAGLFGVGQSTIQDIYKGRSWAWLKHSWVER